MFRRVVEHNPMAWVSQKSSTRGHRLKNPSLILFAEVLRDAIVLGDQAHQASGLMNVEIVRDKMPARDYRVRGHGARNMVDKVFFRAGRSHRRCYHRALGDVKIGDQRQGPTPPRRMYSNSRRSVRPGPMGMVGCLRSNAWLPVISSVESTRSPAFSKAGACR